MSASGKIVLSLVIGLVGAAIVTHRQALRAGEVNSVFAYAPLSVITAPADPWGVFRALLPKQVPTNTIELPETAVVDNEPVLATNDPVVTERLERSYDLSTLDPIGTDTAENRYGQTFIGADSIIATPSGVSTAPPTMLDNYAPSPVSQESIVPSVEDEATVAALPQGVNDTAVTAPAPAPVMGDVRDHSSSVAPAVVEPPPSLPIIRDLWDTIGGGDVVWSSDTPFLAQLHNMPNSDGITMPVTDERYPALQRALQQLANGDEMAALALLTQLRHEAPRHPLVLALLGDAYELAGRREDALRQYVAAALAAENDQHYYDAIIAAIATIDSSYADSVADRLAIR